jgi:lysophospholipase L1-like esterase
VKRRHQGRSPDAEPLGQEHRAVQPRKVLFPLLLIGFCLLLPALGGMVGYQLAGRQAAQDPTWLSPGSLRQHAQLMQQVETMAGAFLVDRVPLDGVDKCYFDDSVDFTRIVWTGRDMPTPFLGFAPQPGPLPGGHINGQQFRYHKDLDRPKPPGICRIFLIGGSTAFGSGATSNETTVGGYLERHLNEQAKQYGCRFEVVTAAAAGWSSPHERILVENRLIEQQPDVVIALSGHNDVFWAMLRSNINCYRSSQDAYYLRLTNALLQSNFHDHYPDTLPGWEESVSGELSAARLKRNVHLARTALETIGADYCFALQPILSSSRKVRTPREDRMANRPWGRPVKADETDIRARYDACRTALSALKAPRYHFWDLTGLFDDDKGSDIFIDRCHFGDRGHDQIARHLRERLAPLLRVRLKQPGK